jgi:hypothetical protein
MRGNGELLSASGSPQSVRRVGVRRLNYIPLYIVGGILAVVALLIAWVASEKGKQQAPKAEDHGGSANDFAVAVAGDKVGYVKAESAATPAPPPIPAAAPSTAVAPTPPIDTETEARHKAFYEALFARSAISDPTVELVSNQRQQAISAGEAAKAVKADPNNLGGSTPGDIADYQQKVAAAQRLLGINGGTPPGPADPNIVHIQRLSRSMEIEHALGGAGHAVYFAHRRGDPGSLAVGNGRRASGHHPRPGKPGCV